MSFGRLGSLGRGFGRLGGGGKVAGPAGLPSLVLSKAAADISNPQTSGLYASPPTVSFSTSAPASITTAYPSSFSVALHQAAYNMEGGLPFSIGGKLFLYNTSSSGASANWTTGSGVTGAAVERRTFTHTGADLAVKFTDSAGGPYYIRLLVADASNGQKPQYTDRIIGYSSPGTAAVTMYMTIDFGSSATRTITLECSGGFSLNNFLRRPADTMSKPAAPTTPTIAIFGDSLSLGAVNNPTTGLYRTTYTASIAAGTGVMTVSSVGIGVLQVGQSVVGVGVPVGTTIASLGTGTGGTGTYNLTPAPVSAVGSTGMTDGEIAFTGDSMARRMLDYLGARGVIDAIGGTGFNTPTAGGNSTIGVRVFTGGNLAAFVAGNTGNPAGIDAIIYLVGINDANAQNGGSQTRSAQLAVINPHIALLASTYPSIPIAIGGQYYGSGFVGAGAVPTGVNPNFEADLFAAVAAAKVATPTARIAAFHVNNIINGSGSVPAPAGDGNADTYKNGDRIHEVTVGEAYEAPILAQRAYACIQSI